MLSQRTKINIIKKHTLFYFLIILTINSYNSYGKSIPNYFITNDSLDIWINQSKNKNLTVEKRKELLYKSYQYILNKKIDKPLKISTIAYEIYKLKDTILFKEVNNKAIELSQSINDYYALGDAHWNYATYFLNNQIYPKTYYHFNRGYNFFSKGNHEYEKARMLFGMANIKGIYRDYYGSEILTIRAIEIYKKLNKENDLYNAYNHLGLLHHDIKNYNLALTFYNKAININKKGKRLAIYNNIANVYRDQGNYKKALSNYDIELNNVLSSKQYAMVLSNKAYCKLLSKDTLNVKRDLFIALSIRDSLDNKEAVLSSKIHVSDYYKYIKDTLKANKFAIEANKLAKELNNGDYFLTTLNQLANLNPKNSKKYLDRYIEFNDSLIIAERRTQNKFTRIEFETDEYIAETERLNQQRIWILVTSIAGLSILSLLYFLRVQKVRNEKLQLEAEQQKANEEVYILTLKQQAKLEEERVNERNRISRELHDGILGKLFGTRVNLGFLAMGMQPETQEKHQTFLDELQEIEKEIRDVSHKLSDNFDNSNINFTNILEQLLKDKSTIGKFNYQFNFDENINWKNINEVTKVNLYRIVQEALQNIIKHAKAKNVILEALIKKKELIISLHDDGVGFNTEKKKKGIGLKNMKNRVEKIGSKLELHSSENKGTTLAIKTPLNYNGK